MTESQAAAIILLALGHPDRGDDQFGPRLLHRFTQDYALPPQVQTIRGTIQPLALYPRLIGCRWLILLDAVQTDPPGQPIIVRDPLSLPTLGNRIAIHQMGIAELLTLLGVLGEAPARVSLIGASLHSLVPGAPLSGTLEARLPEACQALTELLQRHGVAVSPVRADVSHAPGDA